MLVFALILFVLMVMMGGLAVDLMRYETTTTSLQNMLDRSTLAAARLSQSLNPEAVVRDNFAKAGLTKDLIVVTVSEGLNFRNVSAHALADAKPLFLHLIGINGLTAPGVSTAEQRITNIEITLVLDVSGSMACIKITNLKSAANEFVNTVLLSYADDRISIGVLPCSASMFATLSLKQFARDETVTIVAETVLVLPMLLWAYLALFVYWDSVRSMNTVQKASDTVSDIISRERKTVPTTYFDGMRNMIELLIASDQDIKLRINSITYKHSELQFNVLWSYSPGSAMPELTTTTLQALKDRIPKMSDADYATIVETEMPYVPAYNIGMAPMTLQQFIITRPRFVAPTCMTGRVCTEV